ncbi:MAG TPA: DUF1015 domain-containing protein [Verrucomicrobiae bacterium]|jgi:uncharacterized protein (DUF1015 family)|nr:DUF1015 domain-containing protein [Verrucomicrobiae bacterium]
MAQVHPFQAFRYNPQRVPFERVLTQPYDKISPSMQDNYYAADPYNLITVEKGRAYPDDSPQNNVYTRAASALESWIRENVVVQDPLPSFYAYSEEYTVPGTGEQRTRRGFIGAGKLEDYSAGVVFRHEHTLSGPKADRLELLRNTRTQTGQLFMLYSDPQQRIDAILKDAESAPPATTLRDEYGVVHRLRIITDHDRTAAIKAAMEEHKLVIADGHHRYETALNYRNERRLTAGGLHPSAPYAAAPYDFAMMMFVNACSEGLTILPTHRLAANLHDFSWSEARRYLEPWFEAQAFPFADDGQKAEAQNRFLAQLHQSGGQRAIGAYPAAEHAKRAYYVLTLRRGADLSQLLHAVSPLQRQLDVVLLHDGILEPAFGITLQAVTAERNLSYEREASAALDAVARGAAQIAFLLNPVDVDQVMSIAIAGEVMPQKSTDFYPKLLSGITMYRID